MNLHPPLLNPGSAPAWYHVNTYKEIHGKRDELALQNETHSDTMYTAPYCTNQSHATYAYAKLYNRGTFLHVNR